MRVASLLVPVNKQHDFKKKVFFPSGLRALFVLEPDRPHQMSKARFPGRGPYGVKGRVIRTRAENRARLFFRG